MNELQKSINGLISIEEFEAVAKIRLGEALATQNDNLDKVSTFRLPAVCSLPSCFFKKSNSKVASVHQKKQKVHILKQIPLPDETT
jgi:hypothetical protein